MEENKQWYLSKSIWGSIIMVLSIVMNYFKLDLGDQSELVNAIVGLLGSAMAMYGRIKAVKKIGQ